MLKYLRNNQRIKQQREILSFLSTKRIKIKNLLERISSTSLSLSSSDSDVKKSVRIQGWVRSLRSSKKWSFLDIYDGSCLSGIQGVLSDEIIEEYKKISL